MMDPRIRKELDKARRVLREAHKLAESVDWDDETAELLADSLSKVRAVFDELEAELRR